MVVSPQTEHYNLHVMDTYGRAVELDSISFTDVPVTTWQITYLPST